MSRRIILFLALGAWGFLLVSMASFHPEDWPSHQVYPYQPIQNLCGSAGAFVAYHLFFAIGQGIFPILLFSGLCLALLTFHNRISDLWLRGIGLALLSIAFAALVHLIRPGSSESFPEGHGGIIGISASTFLKSHFNTAGSGLILITTFLVGLLLAADDLVIRAPGFIGQITQAVRASAPQFKFRFPTLPKLPSLPGFVTRDAKPRSFADDDTGPLKPAAVLRQNRIGIGEKLPADKTVNGQQIELTYEHDAPAATDIAYHDDSAAPPSEAATIPPPQEQAVVKPLAIINNRQAPTNATGGGIAPKAAGIGMPPEGQSDSPEASAPQTADQVGAASAAVDDGTAKPDLIVRMPNQIKPRNAPPPPPKELGDYNLPTWELLADAEHGFAESQERYVREKAAVLEQALREFNIDAHVVEIDTGPVITMYEISLAAGIKVASITQLTNDIARALMATSVRIVAPVPGKSTVGIEVPNPHKEKVRLKELMALAPEATRKMQIPLFLGKDASGEPLVTDLAAMPHCLIAGTTGSGKSVCINSIIMSIMYTQRPDMVKMILIDPKVVEMAPFKDIPHLMCPVINDTGRATSVLEWACEKMDERYEVLAEAGVRNLAGYNKLSKDELMERFKPTSPDEEAKIPKFLPYMIIIVDELADLMITSGKEVEAFIVRLAQKSRAVGIHLVLATQRPQANVVTGLIKSNMPSRIAFRVNSRMDSRIVLDQNGADLLLGQGDMLFLPPGSSKPIRSQGTFIDDREIRESVKLTRSQAEAQYEPELVQIKARMNLEDMEKDELFDDAVRIVLETKRGSVSLLQRRLTIGYSRASRLIEMMAMSGIVGDYKGSQAREANYTLEEWDAMQAAQKKDEQEGMAA
ncbi:MAG TPA: DNA translocase FtsK [Tepidisphaeraceae bacterium]|nr:DNA translocase FtsK [Tepidisphaeraceae bacterium]